MVAVCLAPLLGGCAVVRYTDYAMPALRFDRPGNEPLPPREDPAVHEALSRWDAMSPEERERYPTPYHAYVNTPDPGTFEGDLVAGLAFSGGGTRGTVFGAACVRELMDLGPVVVHGPEGEVTVDLLDEIDYVSGVSTGAIPAALFALAFGESCPERMRFEHWPDCFNI
ncbi:MAG: patatin-like phospholipase family protein, partial [Candidatus Hydrogenedentes bacterium]|nr:patatin-like phospholipase family protein [Candidatus Hydrogenedentota bacterium]